MEGGPTFQGSDREMAKSWRKITKEEKIRSFEGWLFERREKEKTDRGHTKGSFYQALTIWVKRFDGQGRMSKSVQKGSARVVKKKTRVVCGSPLSGTSTEERTQ